MVLVVQFALNLTTWYIASKQPVIDQRSLEQLKKPFLTKVCTHKGCCDPETLWELLGLPNGEII